MRLKLTLILAMLGTLALSPGSAWSEDSDRTFLGYGRLFTNDLLGDGHDRWQTGSLQTSRVWGPRRQDIVPETFGDLLELRITGQVAAPWDLTRTTAGDRRFATALTFGVHTHFKPNNWQYSLGLHASIIGKKNGIEAMQSKIHEAVGADQLSDFTSSSQIGNQTVLGFTGEASRQIQLSERVNVTPFIEARKGLEDMIRVGGDLRISTIGQKDFYVRDGVTGTLYPTVIHPEEGTAFIIGADTAWVEGSRLLPDNDWATLTQERHRVRLGLLRKGERFSGFYGLTWLSPEFDEQGSGQVVGSLRLDFAF